MYEVTSRKGGQRQQPYGRPCATAREVRDNSRTTMGLLDLHVHRLQRVVRGEGDEGGAKSVFHFDPNFRGLLRGVSLARPKVRSQRNGR